MTSLISEQSCLRAIQFFRNQRLMEYQYRLGRLQAALNCRAYDASPARPGRAKMAPRAPPHPMDRPDVELLSVPHVLHDKQKMTDRPTHDRTRKKNAMVGPISGCNRSSMRPKTFLEDVEALLDRRREENVARASQLCKPAHGAMTK